MEWEGEGESSAPIWDNISGWDFLIPHVERVTSCVFPFLLGYFTGVKVDLVENLDREL